MNFLNGGAGGGPYEAPVRMQYVYVYCPDPKLSVRRHRTRNVLVVLALLGCVAWVYGVISKADEARRQQARDAADNAYFCTPHATQTPLLDALRCDPSWRPPQ